MEQMLFEDVARRVFKIVRLTPEEEEKFLNSDVARACTMAPYACDADDADRYAIQNALTFIAAVKDETFHVRPEDFVGLTSKRLDILFNFPGELDKKDILKGRLIEREYSDYEADVEKDAQSGKYNPVASGDVTDAREMIYEKSLHKDADVDALFTVEQSRSSFWWS